MVGTSRVKYDSANVLIALHYVRIVLGNEMTEPINLHSTDPIIKTLDFKPYHNETERHYKRFLPKPGEPETLEVPTSWGETLTAKAGDYLVGPLDNPDDRWPVDAEIFEKTYKINGPDICAKVTSTDLAPLVDVTGGNQDQMVTIHTLEGPKTVRAGDFFLARGIKDEIWPYPIEAIAKG